MRCPTEKVPVIFVVLIVIITAIADQISDWRCSRKGHLWGPTSYPSIPSGPFPFQENTAGRLRRSDGWRADEWCRLVILVGTIFAEVPLLVPAQSTVLAPPEAIHPPGRLLSAGELLLPKGFNSLLWFRIRFFLDLR